MTDNHMMFHHVRPQHLYSRDVTCTSDDLCRIPQSLVAYHICYFINRGNIYEISIFMPDFNVPSYVPDVFIQYGDHTSLYIVRGDDHS